MIFDEAGILSSAFKISAFSIFPYPFRSPFPHGWFCNDRRLTESPHWSGRRSAASALVETAKDQPEEEFGRVGKEEEIGENGEDTEAKDEEE